MNRHFLFVIFTNTSFYMSSLILRDFCFNEYRLLVVYGFSFLAICSIVFNQKSFRIFSQLPHLFICFKQFVRNYMYCFTLKDKARVAVFRVKVMIFFKDLFVITSFSLSHHLHNVCRASLVLFFQ